MQMQGNEETMVDRSKRKEARNELSSTTRTGEDRGRSSEPDPKPFPD
jgi:hypothetical protein